MGRPAWVEIDLASLQHNVQEIRKATNPKAQVMAIVKANGYGHGLEQVSKIAFKNGVSWLGVALLQEAVLVREKGFAAPVLVLGYTPAEDAAELVNREISQTVFMEEDGKALAAVARRLGKKAKVHIKVDTGMGRLGFPAGDAAVAAVSRLAELPELELEGIYTHLATADEPDKCYAEEQFARFCEVINRLEAKGIKISFRHCANSAAILDLPHTHLDLVRPGICLYGLYPSPDVRHDIVSLKPVMSVKAQVELVKRVPLGSGISYGKTYVTSKETTVATIPLGYADGYSRLLSNKAEVLVGGRRAPVIGRVCMDHLMVDVSEIPGVSRGDEAVLLGKQGSDEITADELADNLKTVNYEIVCMISERLPRVYLNS